MRVRSAANASARVALPCSLSSKLCTTVICRLSSQPNPTHMITSPPAKTARPTGTHTRNIDGMPQLDGVSNLPI